ncbi:hypothetical protein HJFPF1_06343 [Paramyrothecium foliicola]|nr:hypothetical protein HJFPF1_06343 [Paramyrothecium foliicola]
MAMHIPFYQSPSMLPFPPFGPPTTPDSTATTSSLSNTKPMVEGFRTQMQDAGLEGANGFQGSEVARHLPRNTRGLKNPEEYTQNNFTESLEGLRDRRLPVTSPSSSHSRSIHSPLVHRNIVQASPSTDLSQSQPQYITHSSFNGRRSAEARAKNSIPSTTTDFSKHSGNKSVNQEPRAHSVHYTGQPLGPYSRQTNRNYMPSSTLMMTKLNQGQEPSALPSQRHELGTSGVSESKILLEAWKSKHVRGEKQTFHIANQDWPPLSAPTEPASLRRKKMSHPQVSLQNYNSQNAADSGSWSHSKRWTSQATKERIAFQRLMLNLQHIGASKSPFIPQTPAELAALKADIAEAGKQRLAHEVERMMVKNQGGPATAGDKLVSARQEPELFGRKEFCDHLSPFFALENCFNKDVAGIGQHSVDWPSLTELKEEGDRRAAKFNRYLPLPRANTVVESVSRQEGMEPHTRDGSVPLGKKIIKLGMHEIMPVTPPAPLATWMVEEIDALEVPEWIHTLLEEIDRHEFGKSTEAPGPEEL